MASGTAFVTSKFAVLQKRTLMSVTSVISSADKSICSNQQSNCMYMHIMYLRKPTSIFPVLVAHVKT